MSEQPDDDNDDIRDDEQQQPGWRRKLEARAKAGDDSVAKLEAAEARLATLERETTMRELGIDLSAGPGKLFAKAYDGPVDREAMRAAATEYGVLAATNVPAEQQQAMQRIQDAAGGGAVPGGGAPHDFDAELDAIPMVVDGQWNPEYNQQVLAATQVQAAREGRQFVTSSGQNKLVKPGPATTPLS